MADSAHTAQDIVSQKVVGNLLPTTLGGSHRVMSASERIPTRHVFGRSVQTSRTSPTRYSPVLAPVIRTVKKFHPEEDLDVIQRAFTVADKYHQGQKRKSGDPYITHPVAVTTILAEMGATGPVLVAGLLHDTVEDTPYTQEQLIEDFGEEVAYLVDGVTKLDKVTYGEYASIETIRKLVLSMSKDIRVLLIKLADRLHNARTWRFVPSGSAAKKAEETLKIYAPLAHRLGLSALKWELEDLSFAAMSPEIYREIVRMVGDRTPRLEKYLDEAKTTIEQRLAKVGIKATVHGRPKHYYSIHQKMKSKNKSFDEIHDILAVRILVDDEDTCYGVLGHVMSLWTSDQGRFKDYIKSPKNNHYQSIHLTFVGPGNLPLEVQIRTYKMHEEAEYGVAAHWRYKAASRGEDLGKIDASGRKKSENKSSTFNAGILQNIAEISNSTPEPVAFFEELAYHLETDEIVVMTPNGDGIILPVGATPVDFAYAIHSEVGEKTVGAIVNGKIVSLYTGLNSGDVVEIRTSKSPQQGPSEDWLKFVRSSKARQKIRQYFAKGRRLEAIDKGRDALTKAMRQHELPLQKMLTADLLMQVAHTFHQNDGASLYHAIGEGNIKAQDVISNLVNIYYGDEDDNLEVLPSDFDEDMFSSRRTVSDNGIVVPGADGILTKISKCCNPVPPDEILGVVTRTSGISVHRTDCPNMRNMGDEPRVTEVQWASSSQAVYRVNIQVESIDRKSLLMDLTRAIGENHINICHARVMTSEDRFAINRFSVEVRDRYMLDHVLNVLKNVEGVYKVYRLTGAKPVHEKSSTS